MKIVVLVKHVPDPSVTWSFAPDHTIDRDAVDGRLSELDEYAVEQAVRLVEGGLDAEVVCLTVGPAGAADAVRKALAMGAGAGVHVLDDEIHGSDALGTSLVLAEALRHIGFDLVLTGMSSTDAEMSVVPSMVADRLGAHQATFAGELAVQGDKVRIRRQTDAGAEVIETTLPAVVSVTDQTGEARYPAFKAIMMAKKKPVTTLSLADLGVDVSMVGLTAAATSVVSFEKTPPRAAGVLVTDDDDGAGAVQLADFLQAKGLL